MKKSEPKLILNLQVDSEELDQKVKGINLEQMKVPFHRKNYVF